MTCWTKHGILTVKLPIGMCFGSNLRGVLSMLTKLGDVNPLRGLEKNPDGDVPGVRSPASMTCCTVAWSIKSKFKLWIKFVSSQSEIVDVFDVQLFNIKHRLVVHRHLILIVITVVVTVRRHLPARYRTITSRRTWIIQNVCPLVMTNGLLHIAAECWIVHETLKTRTYNTESLQCTCHSQHTVN